MDPTVGGEIAKTRPGVIISNDVGNDIAETVIIAAVTTYRGGRVYRFELLLRSGEAGLTRDSKVLLDQLRTVDKSRLGARLGALSADRMAQVDEAILVSLGIRLRR
jgi:mRNA interferase MazF